MDNLYATLQRAFGFNSFRPGQEAIVRALLDGSDAMVVMPTGSGKSLCFQLPALMLEGTTLVVSPLIALMKDQVDALRHRNISAAYLNSTLSSDETSRILSAMRRGAYKLLYVAPERFRNPRFIEALRETPIAMLAIDEAHCISAWGHDFRPDYLYLEKMVAEFDASVRLLAVTATATEAVQDDILKHLAFGNHGRKAPQTFITGFARPNLSLNVTKVRSHAEKLERLLQIIEFFHTGIVYCSTRKMVDRVKTLLAEHKLKALTYNGAMSDTERTLTQEAFMRREAPVVIATNAFGMGVDRSDIRFVVHWDVPGSMEAYYQEVGRAGRDGAFAWCELLYTYADVKTQEFFIAAANPPPEQVYELYATIRNACYETNHTGVILSPEAWAERAGLKSATTVRHLVALFDRKGLLSRTRQIGEQYSSLKVPKTFDKTQLEAICKELALKEAADRKRLSEFLDYVCARHCRHRFLLSYFGDTTKTNQCTKCDQCFQQKSFPPRQQPTEERLTHLKMILSCIARMHGQGDYKLVAMILRGEAETTYKDLSTYGILTSLSEDELIAQCYALELDGYILGMQILPKGYDLVLDRTQPQPIALPRLKQKATIPSSTRTYTPHIPQEGLATTLRKWVQEEGQRRALPPYCILNSKTIGEIAKRRPTTENELRLISGIGEIKLAKYGDAILSIVQSYESI